jgi:hypothetical protein
MLLAVAQPTVPAAPVGAAAAPTTTKTSFVLDDLLIHVLAIGGSDLHLTAGARPPCARAETCSGSTVTAS